MKDFDTSRDSLISFDEFSYGISRWLDEAKGSRASQAGPGTMKYLEDFHEVCAFSGFDQGA